MARLSEPPSSGRQYAEDAPTQVDDLAPAIPRVTKAPPPPISSRETIAGAAPSPSPSSPSSIVEGGSRGAGSSRGISGSASLVTASETLGLQEITRTRRFMYVAAGLAICQGIALFFVGGHPIAKGIFGVSIGLVVVLSLAFVRLLNRDNEAYTVGRALIVVYATIFAAFSGIYFYGVFSPAPVIVPLGVQFYCTGQSDKASVSVITTCAMTYAILAALVMGQVIPDAGIIHLDWSASGGASAVERIVVLLLVESIFAAVYVTARATRSATLHAIEQHDVVVRSLAQRDALLREARNELVHAMRVGGVGRYSGEVIGKFRLGSLIGRGAMGEVYEAARLDAKQFPENQREAAMKLIHPHFLAEHDVVERFLREAKITSSLNVPNVVKVVDASPADAPIPYLAMERLHGEDLATYLREHKRMGLKKVVTMMRQVAAGLDAAHAAGIIHRDLKPRNLFCARAGGPTSAEVWKILDFGVSKLDSAGEGTLTRGQIVGTPGYMAPEQARAREVTSRADIFSLGVVAYRALTGSPPFSADTSIEILSKICHEQPTRPSDVVKLPEDVDLVLAIALAKDPNDRFATGAELANALDAASRGRIDARLSTRAHAILLAQPWGGLSVR